MVTGAAPVSATVLTFLRAALGCQVSGFRGSCSSQTLSGPRIFFPNVVLTVLLCLIFVWKIMLLLGCLEKERSICIFDPRQENMCSCPALCHFLEGKAQNVP